MVPPDCKRHSAAFAQREALRLVMFEPTLSETVQFRSASGARGGEADGQMMCGGIIIVNEMEF